MAIQLQPLHNSKIEHLVSNYSLFRGTLFHPTYIIITLNKGTPIILIKYVIYLLPRKTSVGTTNYILCSKLPERTWFDDDFSGSNLRFTYESFTTSYSLSNGEVIEEWGTRVTLRLIEPVSLWSSSLLIPDNFWYKWGDNFVGRLQQIRQSHISVWLPYTVGWHVRNITWQITVLNN